ncbi:MAG: 4Fe-4S dicluster domain-containing protein [Thermoanaerobaculia bacterium]
MASKLPSFPGSRDLAHLDKVAADACFQCNRCTAGCPLFAAMDLSPAQMVHHLLLGEWEPVVESDAIWACVHCETCTARCPQQVDVSGLLHAARVAAWQAGRLPRDKTIATYFASFVENLYLYGRSAELPLTLIWKLKSEDYLRDMLLGIRLLSRGKLALFGLPKGGATYRRLYDRVKQKEAAGS